MIRNFNTKLYRANPESENTVTNFKIGTGQFTLQQIARFVDGAPVFISVPADVAKDSFPGFLAPVIAFNSDAWRGIPTYPVNIPFSAFIGETYRGNIVVVERLLLPLRIPLNTPISAEQRKYIA